MRTLYGNNPVTMLEKTVDWNEIFSRNKEIDVWISCELLLFSLQFLFWGLLSESVSVPTGFV